MIIIIRYIKLRPTKLKHFEIFSIYNDDDNYTSVSAAVCSTAAFLNLLEKTRGTVTYSPFNRHTANTQNQANTLAVHLAINS